jgi:hypothetical protein
MPRVLLRGVGVWGRGGDDDRLAQGRCNTVHVESKIGCDERAQFACDQDHAVARHHLTTPPPRRCVTLAP